MVIDIVSHDRTKIISPIVQFGFISFVSCVYFDGDGISVLSVAAHTCRFVHSAQIRLD